jgi:hypothetical protein
MVKVFLASKQPPGTVALDLRLELADKPVLRHRKGARRRRSGTKV